MSLYKYETKSANVADAIQQAMSDISDLATECRESYDNMSSTNLASTTKCEQYGEAADQLEGVSEPDIPEILQDNTIQYMEAIPTRKGRQPSRATRLENAINLLSAVAEHCREGIDSHGKAAEEAEQFADDIQNIIDDIEGVEFPGMFG